jgi:hypothetical protein
VVDVGLGVETVVTKVCEEGGIMEQTEVELEVRGVGDVEEDEVQAGGLQDGCKARLGRRCSWTLADVLLRHGWVGNAAIFEGC